MTHFIFDCDDVLLDWQTGFMKFCSTYGIHLNPAGPQSSDLGEWMWATPQIVRAYVERFNASQAFGSLRACDHANDVVWSLLDAGHTISVLTACGDSAAVRRAREKNLWDWFAYLTFVWDGYVSPFSTIDFLPLGASKFEHLYNASRSNGDLVYVEDSFRHAQSGVVNGIKTYCLRRSHNRRDEVENPESGVIWIDDIRGVLECT